MGESSEVRSQRRYYLLKAQYNATTAEDYVFAQGFWAKQNALPGTPLPSTLPALTKLAAAHYTMIEDVRGADVDELVEQAGLTRSEAQAVLAAIGD